MAAAEVAVQERWYYRKWLRYYLDSCGRHGRPAAEETSLGPFLEKLASKNQSTAQRQQAAQAVRLYLGMLRTACQIGGGGDGGGKQTPPPHARPTGSAARPNPSATARGAQPGSAGPEARDRREAPGVLEGPPPGPPSPADAGPAASAPVHPPRTPGRDGGPAPRPRMPQPQGAAAPAPSPVTGASWVKELETLRNAIRVRNYSPRTSETYVHWTRKFQTCTRSKPPSQLVTEDVKSFLTELGVRHNVAASTQNQAFNALLFFFRHVLGREFGKVEGVVRAKRRRYIPVVLSRAEVDRVVAHLEHPCDLVVLLLYGCGLRVSQALDLRIQCFNLDEAILTVHDGKGQKDRSVPLPKALLPRIRDQFARVAAQRREDLAKDFAGAFLPRQLEKKYPNAGREFIWQWFFPAPRLTLVKATGKYWRYHVLDSEVQKAVKRAAAAAGIPKRVTPHTFRHTFASHLLQANVDIRTIQERLGHSDVKTTMIYTHTVPSRTLKDVGSPLDLDPSTDGRNVQPR